MKLKYLLHWAEGKVELRRKTTTRWIFNLFVDTIFLTGLATGLMENFHGINWGGNNFSLLFFACLVGEWGNIKCLVMLTAVIFTFLLNNFYSLRRASDVRDFMNFFLFHRLFLELMIRVWLTVKWFNYEVEFQRVRQSGQLMWNFLNSFFLGWKIQRCESLM